MPPCAATVCERVGNTLVMQAVFRPGLGAAQRGAQARAAGADHHDVVLVIDELVGRHQTLTPAAENATFRIAEDRQRAAQPADEEVEHQERAPWSPAFWM